jgi:DNA-binding beta-propeller fold protein YncE
VCNYYGNRVTLYALPSGKEIRVIGGKVANVQYPWKVCFTPSGHIIVTEQIHKKIHEITTTGGHHRYIGSENMLYMGLLHGVAANQDVVAVSDPGSLTRQIVLFSYRSGELLRGFGAMGTEPGQLSSSDGLCFSTDGSQVLVAESANNRVSVFSLAGEFVTSFGGEKDVLSQPADVCVTEAGQAVVANQQANNIVVISLKDGSVVKTVCADGVGDARFRYPDSIAYHAGKLYVLNLYSDRVHVFE